MDKIAFIGGGNMAGLFLLSAFQIVRQAVEERRGISDYEHVDV